ncbi:MAG: hypothetical protein ACKOEO_00835 [Planctomycetaceae bacterium]
MFAIHLPLLVQLFGLLECFEGFLDFTNVFCRTGDILEFLLSEFERFLKGLLGLLGELLGGGIF